MSIRKMASVRKISGVHAIPDADKICAYQVDGWRVVDQVGKYNVGDLVIFCEVDSFIPNAIAPFLTKPGHEPKVYQGISGERLRTVKLRKTLSQGLLLPIEVLSGAMVNESDDVSELLGIVKYEPPVPAQLAGKVKGNFPSLIPKTDQERAQNLIGEIGVACSSKFSFEVTEKLEGSSMTCYLIDDEFGVCSRNLNLLRDENNSFWKVAIEQDIEGKLRAHGGNVAIQGELVGPGVQGNIYNLPHLDFYVFDVYDINDGAYLDPKPRREMVESLGIKHVPVLIEDGIIGSDFPGAVDDLLQFADGHSLLNGKTMREGVVFKQSNGGMTFKAVSNMYLLKVA